MDDHDQEAEKQTEKQAEGDFQEQTENQVDDETNDSENRKGKRKATEADAPSPEAEQADDDLLEEALKPVKVDDTRQWTGWCEIESEPVRILPQSSASASPIVLSNPLARSASCSQYNLSVYERRKMCLTPVALGLL